MLRIYKTFGVLAVISILAGLFFATKSPPALPDTQPNSALTETRSEPKAEVQITPTVENPFKKFLDLSDVSVSETNRGTWLKEGFGSSFNLRSEDEIEI